MTRAATDVAPVDLDGFVTRDYARVVAAVRRICGTDIDAEDAVQDALVKLVQLGSAASSVESIPAWVTVVASNGAHSGRRRRGSEERALGRVGVPADSATEVIDGRLDLDRALAALPERQRQIATLHYLLDASVASIAQALEISDGTVKTQLSRARAALAVALGHQEGASDE